VAKATGQALADMSSDLSFESPGAWASAARESIELARISPKSPSGFLKEQIGRAVVVKLNHGVEYRGILACVDGYLNAAMEQTEEYQDGVLRAKLGECFVDGYNVQAVEMDVASLRAAKPKEKFNGVTVGGRQLSFK
jgi:U6 snRNA-associated Sm-like protein LSm6